MTRYQMLIGGELGGAEADPRFDATNPYTRDAFATIPDASSASVGAAGDAAQHALDADWSKVSGAARATLRHRFTDIIEGRADEHRRLKSTDNGQIMRETTGQTSFAARNYSFFAGYADKLYSRTIPPDTASSLDYT